MLCRLVQVPPKTLQYHFMQDLGRDSWQRHPDERMRTTTVDYFSLSGWGQDHYTEADIRQVLAELNAVGSLWPEGGSTKLIEQYSRWRDNYHRYWFKKWYYKVRRRVKLQKLANTLLWTVVLNIGCPLIIVKIVNQLLRERDCSSD